MSRIDPRFVELTDDTADTADTADTGDNVVGIFL